MKGFFKRNRTIIILVLIVAILGGGYYVLRSRRAASQVTQYQTAKIARGNLVATIGATGTVHAQQTALLNWQTSGSVEVVNVKVGDNVPADFVMAYLDKTSLPQNVIAAEADLADAKTTLNNLLNSSTDLAQAAIDLKSAKEDYDKAAYYLQYLKVSHRVPQTIYTAKLVQTMRNGWRYDYKTENFKGPAPQDWITDAENDLALKTAKLQDAQRTYDRLAGGNKDAIASAQARVDAAQATLKTAQIVAPFGGIVTDADPLSGDQVTAGTTAFRIDDLSSLYVDVSVSEVDINSVSVGQSADLSFDAILNKSYHGTVVEVSNVGDTVNGIVNFTVTVQLTDPDSMVKPGMTAAVNIVVNELKDVVLVPNRAVRSVNGDRVVYVMENGKPVEKKIVLGASSDVSSVISGGEVKEGDTIILNPPTQFQGGPGGGGVQRRVGG
jgi:HlyD family secretion protein